MADKPVAEVVIDEWLVRRLLASRATEIPDAAALPLVRTASGWDSEIWRLGEDLAVRLPRRALAAPLILNEHRSLAVVGPAIEAAGVRVPAPVVRGAPGELFPWAWSVVPWIHGARGIDVPRAQRAGWAETLARALAALHVEAPADHPVNPVRGRPLATRAAVFAERVDALAAAGSLTTREARALAEAWTAGIAAPAWHGPAVWIHGDLHTGNLVADGPRLTGIIDFGDVTAGDPAYDLAVAWLAFDPSGRGRFIAATGARYDRSTWTRARAWAAAVAVLLLAHSDDEPDYEALGRSALDEIDSGI
ncbi:aminoglycoside phosphotransferase family protein [Microbacterium sp. SSM24]|uniref:aminoglycoside phosphotransferase family protein n=1 Tax=Microbacterium sp. SSM24 TaxID=2991714 RepID=UPI002227F46A|nr:aminoglycoside phosphotransferase family protein [Microbacterium sp. SSM24]MCW3494232.1 aminoglycoside phosphotransferase family protein [Microbacterium sp. SSM24]